MSKRILVTGSRNWRDREAIWSELDKASRDAGRIVLVHGACPTGADQIADEWGIRAPLVNVERHPANWSGPCRANCRAGHRRRDPQRGSGSYCPMAGFYRNQEMVDLGADIVLAFQLDNSRGTQDCVDRAKRAGLDYRVIGPEGTPEPSPMGMYTALGDPLDYPDYE